MNKIGITVEAQTAEAQQQMQALLTGMREGFEKIGGLGNYFEELKSKLVALFTVGAMVEFTHQAIETEAAMEQLHEKSGLAVETISAFSNEASKTNLAFADLNMSLGMFSDKIYVAMRQGGQAAQVFRDMNISLANERGQFIGLESVLRQVMDWFHKMPDGEQKSAVAMELFGRSGRQLIPILNQGSQSMEQMKESARQMGALVTSDQAEKAEQFERAVKDLEITVRALFQQFANDIIPTLQQFVDWLKQMEVETAANQGAAASLSQIFRGLVTVVLALATAFQSLGTILGNYVYGAWENTKVEAIGLMNVLADIIQVIQSVDAAFADLQNAIVSAIKLFVDLTNSILETILALEDVAHGRFRSAVGRMRDEISLLKSDFSSLAGDTKNFFGDIASAAQGVGHAFADAFTSAKAQFVTLWDNVKSIGGNVLDQLSAQWSKLGGMVNKLWTPSTAGTSSHGEPGKEISGSLVPTSEEAKRLIEEIDKAYAESTAGRIALLDQEEAKWKEKADDEILNVQQREEEKTKITEIYARKRKDILDKQSDEEAQLTYGRSKLQEESISKNPFLSEIDKAKAMLPLLQQQMQMLDQAKAKQQSVIYDATSTPEEQLAAEKQLLQIDQERENVIEKIRDINSQTFMGTLKRDLQQAADQWQNLGRAMAHVTFNTVTAAVNGLANALTNVIMGTEDAGKAFGQFAISLLTQFISSILEMILWAKLAIPILTYLGIVSGGATMGPGIAMTSAAVGMSTAVAATLAADGGLITGPGGPKDDLIPAQLSNGEFVLQAAAVQHYGADFLHRLNRLQIGRGSSVMSGIASAGVQPLTPIQSNVNVNTQPQINIGVLDNTRQAVKEWLASPEGQKHLVDLVKRKSHDLGIGKKV